MADSVIKLSQLPILEIPEQLKINIDELNQLIIDNQLLLSSYKENTQAYRIKKQRINYLKGEITNMMEVFRKNYNDELNSLYTRKLELLKNFESLPSKGTEFNKYKRAFDLEEQVYLSLQQKKTEFEIAEAGTKPDFVILSSASLPHEPIYPNTLLVYAIGAVAGFVLSLLFIGVKYLLHNKITSQVELEKISLAPILGAIPYYKDADLHLSNLVIDKNPKSGITEAFRSIRTNMEFMRPNQKNRVISVSSTISSEGKTFISINLGAIIAMSNLRVIIVDIDLRNPNIHHAFDEENTTRGVSTILINKNAIADCIRKTELDNLDFLAAGPKPPNPAELILSTEFDDMVERLKEQYDVVILDTPPVGLVTDGILVMKKVDLPIFVVRADYSKKSFIYNINR